MAFWNRNKFEAMKPSEEEIREARISELKKKIAALKESIAERELHADVFKEKYVRSARDSAELNDRKTRLTEFEAELMKLEPQKESEEGQEGAAA